MTNPPKIAIRTWVMNPCCNPVKISSGSWPLAISRRESGSARKLKIGRATVKQASMQIVNASTE